MPRSCRAGVPPTLSKGSLRVTQVSPAIEAVVKGRGWGGQLFLSGRPPTGSWLLCAPISHLDGRLGVSIQAPGPHPAGAAASGFPLSSDSLQNSTRTHAPPTHGGFCPMFIFNVNNTHSLWKQNIQNKERKTSFHPPPTKSHNPARPGPGGACGPVLALLDLVTQDAPLGGWALGLRAHLQLHGLSKPRTGAGAQAMEVLGSL